MEPITLTPQAFKMNLRNLQDPVTWTLMTAISTVAGRLDGETSREKALRIIEDSDARGQPRDELHIAFAINGVELPFHEVVEELWTRTFKDLDEQAKKRALEILKGSALGGIFIDLENLEWKFQELLDRATQLKTYWANDEVKVRLADGSEVMGKIVHTDDDTIVVVKAPAAPSL